MAPGAARGLPRCALLLGGAALLLLFVPAAVPEPSGAGCAQKNSTSCEECLKNVSCLWCNTNKVCLDYPVRKILPPASLCQLSSARWGICWVNFEALIITMSVLGGSVVLGISVACCCCCCCRRKRSRKPDKSDERAMREQEERRVRQEERRAEMKSRHDEIRRKYGLFKEKNPYEKF